MGARILERVSIDDYYADRLEPGMPPTLNASVAKLLVTKTPGHARLAHPRLRRANERHEDDRTEAKARGTLLHRLVLGRGAELTVIDAYDYKTKSAQFLRDKALAERRIPVLREELAEMTDVADAMRGRLTELGVDLDGSSEVVVTWTEYATDGTAVQCRAMMDHLRPEFAQGLDLKVTESADLSSCERASDSYDYDIQSAAYRSALRELFPDRAIDFVFAFAEPSPPYSVTLAGLDGMHQNLGDQRWRRAVDLWAEHTTSGVWPPFYSRTRVRLAAKPWKITHWHEREAS